MTAQTSDDFIYEGERYMLLAKPLESYFKQHPPRPSFAARSSINWSGYTAAWEIVDDRFYLAEFLGTICASPPEKGAAKSSVCLIEHNGECVFEDVNLNDLFGLSTTKVFADWYTNEVRVPDGEMAEYVHAGYASKYKRYLMINIVRGVVTNLRSISSDEYEKEQEVEPEPKPTPWWRFWNS